MTETKKKVLIISSIILAVVVVFVGLANLIGHFMKPNNHNEARYHTYNIRLSGWDEAPERQYVNWANQTLPELNRLGPTFHIVTTGEDVVVVRGTTITDPTQCTRLNGLSYQVDQLTGQRRIVIDPTCVHGELEFKSAFMHEIGHSLGMGHVCTSHDRDSDCSPVGRGLAIMNPNLLNEVVEGNGFDAPVGGPVPTWEVQDLDVREFCRTHGGCQK